MDIAECDLERVVENLNTILFAVTADADVNDGKVDRAAVWELCREIIALVTGEDI